MTHILLALVSFILSIVLHIVYCRKAPLGTLHAKAFIIIAIANGLAMGISFLFLPPLSQSLPCTAVLLYLLAIPSYLIFYVTTLLVSPSKRILQLIQSGDGASYEMLATALGEENFIALRLEELCASGCVRRVEETFILTASGKNIARILGAYRKILGRGPGG